MGSKDTLTGLSPPLTDKTPPTPGPSNPTPPPSTPAFNPADPTSAPSMEQLKAVKYVSTTSSVATQDEIRALGTLFSAIGLDSQSIGPAMWDLARAYADVQSSRSAVLSGSTPSNPAITRQMLVRQLDKINLTPRQFCMFFAKVVWNILIDTNVPPAGWAKLGYTEDTKFAAFDFFDGVLSPAALNPADGLIRHPNQKEMQAHSVAKCGALARQRISNGNFVSTLGEVTHGKVGGINTMYSIEAPPDS